MSDQKNIRLTLVYYFLYLFDRIRNDRLSVHAGYMAYITVLSLTPVIALFILFLSYFSAFDGVIHIVQEFFTTILVPTAGEQLFSVAGNFKDNAGKLGVMGVGLLIVLGSSLISNTDKHLNFIWRTKKSRGFILSFLLYCILLALAPLLVGIVTLVSTYLMSLHLFDSEVVTSFYKLIPFLLVILGFFSLYFIVPNKKVNPSHALIGAVFSSIIFELIKYGFFIYINKFSSYHLIYGALAIFPIVTIWIYLSWFILFFGAEVTVSMGEREQWNDAINNHPILYKIATLLEDILNQLAELKALKIDNDKKDGSK